MGKGLIVSYFVSKGSMGIKSGRIEMIFLLFVMGIADNKKRVFSIIK